MSTQTVTSEFLANQRNEILRLRDYIEASERKSADEIKWLKARLEKYEPPVAPESDDSENTSCQECGAWYNEILIGRGYLGDMDKCPDCGGEWITDTDYEPTDRQLEARASLGREKSEKSGRGEYEVE